MSVANSGKQLVGAGLAAVYSVVVTLVLLKVRGHFSLQAVAKSPQRVK